MGRFRRVGRGARRGRSCTAGRNAGRLAMRRPQSRHTVRGSLTRSSTCWTNSPPRVTTIWGSRRDPGYQMRRHARRMRRHGLQPMIIMSPGDRLPGLVVTVPFRTGPANRGCPGLAESWASAHLGELVSAWPGIVLCRLRWRARRRGRASRKRQRVPIVSVCHDVPGSHERAL